MMNLFPFLARRFPLLLAVMMTAPEAHSENWPGFRGPTGQGISSERNLPVHWSAESNVVWAAEVPGEGWSSPMVWEDSVVLTTTTERGTKCHVLALDRRTGKLRWSKEVFEQIPRRKESKNSYATPTPATDGSGIYAVFGDGSMAALDFDGGIVWTNREVKFYSRHGLGSSPIIYENLVIMPFDWSNPIGTQAGKVTDEERMGWQIPWDKSFIVALDTATGKNVWTARRGMSRIAHATPLVIDTPRGKELMSIAGDVIQGFDLKTGERLWSLYSQGEGLVPSPVYGGGMIFASSGFEKTTMRAVKLPNRGDLSATNNIVWEQRKGAPTQPSLIRAGGRIFTISDGGVATCFNETDGEIVWQERIGGNHSASPVWADGKIYFLSEEGETTVIEAGPEFKIIAKNPLNAKCQASLAASQGNIYIRSESRLFCIGTVEPRRSF